MDGLDRNRKTKNIQKEKKDRQQAKMNVYQHFCYHNLLFLSERENQNLWLCEESEGDSLHDFFIFIYFS